MVQLPSRPTVQTLDTEQTTATPLPIAVSSASDAVSDTTPQISPPSAPEASVSTDPTISSVSGSSTGGPAAVQSRKRSPTKPIVPAIPIKPVVPTLGSTSPKQLKSPPVSDAKPEASAPVQSPAAEPVTLDDQESAAAAPQVPVRVAPKSWAELLKSKAAAANAAAAAAIVVGSPATDGIVASKPSTLADALSVYSVDNDARVSFLEPRGLVNTGNMCYMNSVSCIPHVHDFELLTKLYRSSKHSSSACRSTTFWTRSRSGSSTASKATCLWWKPCKHNHLCTSDRELTPTGSCLCESSTSSIPLRLSINCACA